MLFVDVDAGAVGLAAVLGIVGQWASPSWGAPPYGIALWRSWLEAGGPRRCRRGAQAVRMSAFGQKRSSEHAPVERRLHAAEPTRAKYGRNGMPVLSYDRDVETNEARSPKSLRSSRNRISILPISPTVLGANKV